MWLSGEGIYKKAGTIPSGDGSWVMNISWKFTSFEISTNIINKIKENVLIELILISKSCLKNRIKNSLCIFEQR